MQVDAVDPARLDEATAESLHRLDVALSLEDVPEDRPRSKQRLLAELANPEPENDVVTWVALDGGEVVGWCQCVVRETPDNRHLAFVAGGVHPAARRRGVGRALVRLAAERAEAAGRRLLQGTPLQGTAGEAFFEGLGGRLCYHARCSRAYRADIDADRLRRWVERAPERAAGYTLLAWDMPTPEQHLDAYAKVLHAMNTAPMEDLDWEPEVFTPELVQGWERRGLAVGDEKWVVVARHDASGEVVGLSEMVFETERPELCWQGNTGVDPAHRGKGLGRWLKAVNGLRLLAEKPDVAWIETDNNDANEPMLAINTEMGFRYHRMYTEWQVPVEEVLKRTA